MTAPAQAPTNRLVALAAFAHAAVGHALTLATAERLQQTVQRLKDRLAAHMATPEPGERIEVIRAFGHRFRPM